MYLNTYFRKCYWYFVRKKSQDRVPVWEGEQRQVEEMQRAHANVYLACRQSRQVQ